MSRPKLTVSRGASAILRDLKDVFDLAREMTGAYIDMSDQLIEMIDGVEPEVRACVYRYSKIRAAILKDSAADLEDAG